MAKKIDGIKFIKTKEYAYCNIEYFSDELKSVNSYAPVGCKH